jgi:hypothetical protein
MDSVIDHIKAEARRLQRAANKREPVATLRVRKLPELRALPEVDLEHTLQRRHCLTVVTRELGFQGWPHALSVLQRADSEDFGTLLSSRRWAWIRRRAIGRASVATGCARSTRQRAIVCVSRRCVCACKISAHAEPLGTRVRALRATR